MPSDTNRMTMTLAVWVGHRHPEFEAAKQLGYNFEGEDQEVSGMPEVMEHVQKLFESGLNVMLRHAGPQHIFVFVDHRAFGQR